MIDSDDDDYATLTTKLLLFYQLTRLFLTHKDIRCLINGVAAKYQKATTNAHTNI